MNLATAARSTVATRLGNLRGIAHSGTTLYATGGSGKLYEVEESGTVRVVASGLGLSQGIAMDVRGGACTADMFTRLRPRDTGVQASAGASSMSTSIRQRPGVRTEWPSPTPGQRNALACSPASSHATTSLPTAGTGSTSWRRAWNTPRNWTPRFERKSSSAPVP
ncbi:hypothetical protein [Streptomyces sp. NPDC102264]|uniref:hypothetical protein n=1 Tax=Streptomyces sp. NPDC102264 TaxID=3366149 RepID=UPI0037FEDB90